MPFLNQQISLKTITILVITLAAAVGFSACGFGNEGDTPQKSEAKAREGSYKALVEEEPAQSMEVSPTRRTINFWIEKWGHDPNKLSYVYLQAANGQLTGYYIFKGLPVSYCAALTPNYELIDTPDDGSDQKNQQVPAPSVDGVYYSGGQCDAYYGEDASTGAYIEYTAGGSQNVLIYDKPLPKQNVEPLGFTTIEEVKK